MTISLFLMGAFGCVAALVHNIYLFMALRFVQGIFFPVSNTPYSFQISKQH
jgi:MFS family permease